MTARTRKRSSSASGLRAVATAIVAGAVLLTPVVAAAQGQGPTELGPDVQLPRTLRAAAPVDLTGTWVSVVSEDWRWRILTAARGDYAAVPLSADGRRAADNWDPGEDAANGLQCRAYGAAGIVRLPGRINVSWQDDNTLRLDFDAGTQTRLLRYGAPLDTEGPSWQGQSIAFWELPVASLPRARGTGEPDPPAGPGTLKAVTTDMRAGYLRKNGVPYSDQAVLTEYFERVSAPNGDEWLVVTSIVEDPLYLNEPFVTSTHFRKEPDDSRFAPAPCTVPSEVLNVRPR